MAFGKVESMVLGSLFEATAEELGVLLSSMQCKEVLEEVERKKANENEKISKILRRADKILENYGTVEKFQTDSLKTNNKLTTDAEKDADNYLYDEKVKKQISQTINVLIACSKELQDTGTYEALKAHIEDSSLQLVKLSRVVNTQIELQTRLKNMQKKVEDFKKESDKLLLRRRRLIELLNNRLQQWRKLKKDNQLTVPFLTRQQAFSHASDATSVTASLRECVKEQKKKTEFYLEIITERNHWVKQFNTIKVKHTVLLLLKWQPRGRKELRIKVNMEKRFWAKNVEVAVAEERVRRLEKEGKLTTAIAKAGFDVGSEKRTQSDINAWMLNNNARLEAQIEYMAEKHRTDFAALQKAYSELLAKRNKHLDALTTLIYEFKRMDDVVEEYKAQMVEKKKKEDAEKSLDEAVIKVQAWWRCMIVAHKILRGRRKGRKRGKKRQKLLLT